jgi:hypothetical protein
MLRHVAYDTPPRRDRKARHLAVAAHLRAAFPGDGEEVTDVIASLTRAAERAERTGAPALAAASYASAAQLTQTDTAIAGLREHSTPYHLAHGLLDHAEGLTPLGSTEAAEAACAEARGIVGRLRCQPLLDRAANLTSARSPARA